MPRNLSFPGFKAQRDSSLRLPAAGRFGMTVLMRKFSAACEIRAILKVLARIRLVYDAHAAHLFGVVFAVEHFPLFASF